MKKLYILFLILLQFGFSVLAENSAPTSVSSTDQTKTKMTIPSNAVLDPSITDKASEIVIEDVHISSYSTLFNQGKSTELKMINHGMRKKKVFGLATVKVYMLEFFAADPTQLNKSEDGILGSLKKAQPVELKLSMERDLSGKKITDSFKEALEHNGVDINNLSKEMSELISELSTVKEFEKGQSISLLATWKDANATLFVKRADGTIKTITGNEAFVTDLFAIWFGKPADDKLADLKKLLIK